MDFSGDRQFFVGPGRVPSAIWLVNKPRGVSSFSLVRAFKDANRHDVRLKVSHGGVLDPFAEGLLLLLVGAANRLFEALHEVPKTYVATVEWGAETDTGDLHGTITERGAVHDLTPGQLEAALTPFLGWTEQVPPATSNKRVDGERAYVRAHRGETVLVPPSPVFMGHAQWVAHELPLRSQLRLVVRGGFYVRSVVRDLARAVGTRAHVSALRRERIGTYGLPQAPQAVTRSDVLPWLPSATLTDDEWGALKAERPLARPTASGGRVFEGFPPLAAGIRLMHRERLVALWSQARVTLLPGGL